MFTIQNKKILITGSESMLGKTIINQLLNFQCSIRTVSHKEVDLTNWDETLYAFNSNNGAYDYVFHCAGFNGNISFNRDYPASIFYKTTQMGLNVLHAATITKVKKVVSLISSCAYPDLGNEILKEKDFWHGEPNPSVDAHGFSKRILLEYGRQIYKQYGMAYVGMCVNTAYGPFDNYQLEKTKVVGSLIRKFVAAKNDGSKEVECWGTGEAKREFIYCDDVGKYAIEVLQKYHNPNYPINIGSGIDYTIKELAEIIASVVGYKGSIIWNTSKPDGQMRKLLCNDKMIEEIGHLGFINIRDGIQKTVEWYENKYNSALDSTK